MKFEKIYESITYHARNFRTFAVCCKAANHLSAPRSSLRGALNHFQIVPFCCSLSLPMPLQTAIPFPSSASAPRMKSGSWDRLERFFAEKLHKIRKTSNILSGNSTNSNHYRISLLKLKLLKNRNKCLHFFLFQNIIQLLTRHVNLMFFLTHSHREKARAAMQRSLSTARSESQGA